MSSLIETVADIGQRVGALETKNINTSDGIARISKVYGNIRLTVTVSAFAHTYRKCGDTAPLYAATCGSDTYL